MVRKRVNNSDTCSSTVSGDKRVETSWSEADRRRVAETLAIGYSQNRAAQLTGVPQRTISLWYSKADFRQLVADLTVEFLANRESVHAQTVAMAGLVIHQTIAGERERDDAVDLAFEYLRETEFPIRRGREHKRFGQA